MDTTMRVGYIANIEFAIMLLVISLMSCGTRKVVAPDYSHMSVVQLEQRLYKEHDIESFEELVTRSFYSEHIDVTKYAQFLTDSLHSIQALTFMGKTPGERMYYLALNEAYSIDMGYVEIFALDSLKDEIYKHYDPLCWEMRHSNVNIDSLKACIIEMHDTSAYLALRGKIHTSELKTYTQLMADEASFATAIQDMYDIINIEHWNGYPMDSATFALADAYMEKGVERGYLPSILQKSLLLLMGVYLPQDTTEGKRLLDCCLKNPPCTTPFWRIPNSLTTK